MKLKPCLWIFIFCHNATARQENWTTRSTIYILKDRTCKDNFIWCKVIYKGVLATDGVRLNLLFWFVNGGSDELHFKESTSLYNKFEFGLICKKAKHARLCQQTFHFCSADIFSWSCFASFLQILNPNIPGLFEVLSHPGGGSCGPPPGISAVGP